jgi:hypothetical protein
MRFSTTIGQGSGRRISEVPRRPQREGAGSKHTNGGAREMRSSTTIGQGSGRRITEGKHTNGSALEQGHHLFRDYARAKQQTKTLSARKEQGFAGDQKQKARPLAISTGKGDF